MLDSSEMVDEPIPPPLDLEDEQWDDDVLPPPSACASVVDDASMLSDLPPYVVPENDLDETPPPPLNPSRWLPDPSTPTVDPQGFPIPNAASTSEVSEASAADARLPLESESTPSIRSVNDDTFCKCDVFGPIGGTGILENLKPYVSPPAVQEIKEPSPVLRTATATSEIRSSTFAPNVVSPSTATTRCKTDQSLPEGMQVPHLEAKPPHRETPDIDLTQHPPLDPSKCFFYPRAPMAPEPSAPFEEPNDSTEVEESPLAMILNALDPSERTAFLVDQNKILENIQKRASNEEASLEAARRMSAMEADAEFARKLQEQERAIRDERTTVAQCWTCQKRMYVPKGAKRAYCPVCKAVCLFEDKSKKNSRAGFFGIKKMKKK